MGEGSSSERREAWTRRSAVRVVTSLVQDANVITLPAVMLGASGERETLPEARDRRV